MNTTNNNSFSSLIGINKNNSSKLPQKSIEQIYIMLGIIITLVIVNIFYYCEPMVESFDVSNASVVTTHEWQDIKLKGFTSINTCFIVLSIISMIATIAFTLLIYFERPLERCIKHLYGIIISPLVSIFSIVIPLFILKEHVKSSDTQVFRFTTGGIMYIVFNIVVVCIALLIIDKIKENLSE